MVAPLILTLPPSDQVTVKLLIVVTIAAALAAAQSQPAPPDAEGPIQPATPVRFEITHVEDSQPQIIRILNLPEGNREFVLPPPSQAQTARILNLDDGPGAIVFSPAP